MKRISQIDSAAVLLLFLTCFFVGVTGIWIHLNRGPTFWDDSWYLIDSLKMFRALGNDGLYGWGREFLNAQARIKPPLMCALPTAVYLIFGPVPKSAFWIQLAFMPVLFFSIFGIVRKLWNPRAALLAVFIAGSMPVIYGLSTAYLVEFGLAALTSLAIWALIQSDYLTRTSYVLLFSTVCGLGVLQKILFPVYVAPLLICFLIGRIKRRDSQGPSSARTLAALVLPALVIAGPWYAYNLPLAFHRGIYSGFSHEEADLHGTGNPLSLIALARYALNIVNQGIGAPYFLIAAAAIVVTVVIGRRKINIQREPRRWIVLGWWAIPFVIFAFSPNKGVRFIAPILLVLAIVLAVLIERILERFGNPAWLGIGPMLALALACQLQILFEPLGPRQWSIPRGNGPDNLQFVAEQIGGARAYDRKPWPLEAIVWHLHKIAGVNSPRVFQVCCGDDTRHFNSNNLQLAADAAGLKINFITTAYAHTQQEIDNLIDRTDVFLYRDGGETANAGYNVLAAYALAKARQGSFEQGDWPSTFPDGATLHLFVRKTGDAARHTAFVSQSLSEIEDCDVLFGGKIRLTGLSCRQSGDHFFIRYRWQCESPAGGNYLCFTHFVNEAATVAATIDHDPLGGNPPLAHWIPGDSGIEEIEYPMSCFPPGKIGRLEIGIYLPATHEILHAAMGRPRPGWSLMRGDIGVHLEFPLPLSAGTTLP